MWRNKSRPYRTIQTRKMWFVNDACYFDATNYRRPNETLVNQLSLRWDSTTTTTTKVDDLWFFKDFFKAANVRWGDFWGWFWAFDALKEKSLGSSLRGRWSISAPYDQFPPLKTSSMVKKILELIYLPSEYLLDAHFTTECLQLKCWNAMQFEIKWISKSRRRKSKKKI